MTEIKKEMIFSPSYKEKVYWCIHIKPNDFDGPIGVLDIWHRGDTLECEDCRFGRVEQSHPDGTCAFMPSDTIFCRPQIISLEPNIKVVIV